MASDIENYDYQREFTNYYVDETLTTPISSSRVEIDDGKYYIYKLHSTVSLYDYSANLQGTLPADTKIALESPNTGETHNELIYVYKIYNEESQNWESPVEDDNAFITYQLED